MTPPTASEHGWAARDQGAMLKKACRDCGRVLYAAIRSTELLCDGCGDPEGACPCPEIRELA
jgi:hypothetical protein